MQEINPDKQSKLIPVLREGVGLVQMVFYKEVRRHLHKQNNTSPETDLATLAGTITNEIFGTPNVADRFRRFREQNHGAIEQEMLSLSDYLGDFCDILTDALRIQTLCDHQENGTESSILLRARELGILREEREIPLPSSFITKVRELGEAHGLIIAPLQAD